MKSRIDRRWGESVATRSLVILGTVALVLCGLAPLIVGTKLGLDSDASGRRGPHPSGLDWAQLSDAERAALLPLRDPWSAFDTARRRRWIAVADRIDALPEAQKTRVQARMMQWAQLTPQARSFARLQFIEWSSMPSSQRHALWGRYSETPHVATPARPPQRGLEPVAPSLAQVRPGASTVLLSDLRKSSLAHSASQSLTH